jgi:hypothetical protein
MERYPALCGSDPIRYADCLEMGDPKAFDPNNCCVCGLLAEYHDQPVKVVVWAENEHERTGERAVCSPRCLEVLRKRMASLEGENSIAMPIK